MTELIQFGWLLFTCLTWLYLMKINKNQWAPGSQIIILAAAIFWPLTWFVLLFSVVDTFIKSRRGY